VARKPKTQQVAEDAASETKSAKTRQRILDAAAHVLSMKGYAGTRLSDVAEYAELQAPAIYYYFPSREELIEEVMWSGIAHMVKHLQSVLDEIPSDVSPLARRMIAIESHLRHDGDPQQRPGPRTSARPPARRRGELRFHLAETDQGRCRRGPDQKRPGPARHPDAHHGVIELDGGMVDATPRIARNRHSHSAIVDSHRHRIGRCRRRTAIAAAAPPGAAEADNQGRGRVRLSTSPGRISE